MLEPRWGAEQIGARPFAAVLQNERPEDQPEPLIRVFELEG